MSNVDVTPIRAHVKKSEEQNRLEKLSRQLWHKTEIYGFYVRAYYIQADDSFFLEWRLPDSNTGDRYFVNVDDYYFSLDHCLNEIDRFCKSHGTPSPCSAGAVRARRKVAATRRVL